MYEDWDEDNYSEEKQLISRAAKRRKNDWDSGREKGRSR